MTGTKINNFQIKTNGQETILPVSCLCILIRAIITLFYDRLVFFVA
jgi:hypothetical protein